MRVVRSPVAHGRIKAIDASRRAGAARRACGVDRTPTSRTCRRSASASPASPRSSPTASRCWRSDVVRYVGEPVAVVFAEDAYVAEDAADLVELDIEPLPLLMYATERPGVFDDEPDGTEADLMRKGYGDVDAAFRNGPCRRRTRAFDRPPFRRAAGNARRHRPLRRGARRAGNARRRQGAALESRHARAECWAASRRTVQLYEGHVGGGFGIRGEIYPEDVLVCAAALQFRRPIKWIEDRREHLIAANHSRQQHHRVRAAVDAEGHILGIDDEFFHDNGAYMRTHAATVPDLAAAMLPGPYRVPAYRAAGHIRLTNKTPCGTYRAPGRYESTFVRERLIDAIAAQARARPGRNPPPQSDRARAPCPMRSASTRSAPTSSTIPATMPCCSTRRWNRPTGRRCKRELAARRAQGEMVGAGLALFVEKSGLGPFDDVRIEVEARRQSRSSPASPPSARAWRRRSRRSAPKRSAWITPRSASSTARPTASRAGMGAFASRVTVMCGEATRLAATQSARAGLAGRRRS